VNWPPGQAAASLLKQEGAPMLRVDLNAHHMGGDLVLAALQRRVLAVTRQADALSVHADVGQAIGSMGGCAAVTAVDALPSLLPPHDPGVRLAAVSLKTEIAGSKTRPARR
jgi:hypothetical protein